MNFDIPTFPIKITALRDIEAGQQLFYCYCDFFQSTKERQKQLAAFNFVCQCRACVNTTPESDKLRTTGLKSFRKKQTRYLQIRSSTFVHSIWRRRLSKKGWTLGSTSSSSMIFTEPTRSLEIVQSREYANKCHKFNTVTTYRT